jgi:hypothetical protein
VGPFRTLFTTLFATLFVTFLSHSSHSYPSFRITDTVALVRHSKRAVASQSIPLGLEELWGEVVAGGDARGFFTW